jgi:hypothetical protein
MQEINPIQIDKDFCISSCLSFRYVAKDGIGWRDGLVPEFPHLEPACQIKVRNAGDVLAALKAIISKDLTRDTGMLLSGGMDSAILAALLPAKTPAYTIRFIAKQSVDESVQASLYAKNYNLSHHIIDIDWKDYEECTDLLMKHKKAPLHPVEVGLFQTGRRAKADGINRLILGNGADSTFGGLDKLLSRDWTFNDFIRRYTFVDPAAVVKRPVNMVETYEPYRNGDGIDVIAFLKVVHGLGVVQAFENAIHAAGCSIVAPYEDLVLDAPLDIERIRNGQSKYIVREVFSRLYPGLGQPDKIAFARPMDEWLGVWPGPKRHEFREDLDSTKLTGDQKWIVYCLERFLDIHSL